ncbi:RagB/SusD family nutrient uptake outer membrane protein [Bacteroides fluxus]|uniref:RagB/SusD family nutrient uptake outer membrane protein n=1 Tax=Bacteroides fluxus TaxID=626930 RepID=UPI002353CE17|nr:RagB/SusD family nutrient uptake outer membrane protein [Bacteroides fluxus]
MKIKNIIAALLIGASLYSCDYLDIVPDDTPVLSDAFKNEQTAENFVFACYSFIPNYLHYRENLTWCTTPEVVGSSHWTTTYFTFLRMQQALYNSSDPVIDIWQSSYNGIRQCYTFLENIDMVKPSQISPSELEDKKTTWKAEVKFLIAYYHYLLLQNYGPIVILEKSIDLNAPKEELFRPRIPYDECVEKIAGMFDAAAQNLPTTVKASNYGRATKVTAQALKARMYLYAASPQFNGNAQMYKEFKNKDGQQLISQTYNKEKWKKAMDECKKAIQMAEQAGIKLYTYTKKTNLSAKDQAIANTRNVVVDAWNQELIWGYSGWKESWGDGGSIQTAIIPKGISTSSGAPWGALGATAYSADLFLTENGLPIDEDPAYNYPNRYTVPEGDSVAILHRNREPRFYGAIGFNRGDYFINGDTINLKMKFKEKNGTRDPGSDQLYGSYAISKLVHPETFVSGTSNSLVTYPFPIIRLGELYLSYAEAYYEYNGTLADDALTYFNAIRRRAGIPDIEISYKGLPEGKNLEKVIRRERIIELMFEGQMAYDYRRWLTAIDEWKGMEKGMFGLNPYGKTNEEYYQPTCLDTKPFVFRPEQYLSPINQNYLNINSQLVQNPGW